MIFTGNNTNLKIEPYENCPCESGEKFKFCCFPKAKISKPSSIIDKGYSDGRINHMVMQNWEETDFEICFGFNRDECKNEIKSAHSIQNNRILNRISKDNHVYSISSKISKAGIEPMLKKLSKNKASTFFGFCDHHDTEIFKPIELAEYSEQPLQNFLFAFRALALEYHKKQRKLKTVCNMFKNYPHQMLDEGSVYLYRTSQLDVRDHQHDYEIFKSDYLNDDFNRLRTIYRKLNFEIEFATCSAFSIQYDLNGKEINNIFSTSDEKMPSVYVNVYPIDGGTNIILSYHLEDEIKYQSYFDQLESLSDENLVKHLNYLIIQYTENVFFSPTYVETLTEKQQDSLLRTFTSSLFPLEKLDLIIEGNYYNFNLFNSSAE